jgi:hypothetical protein
MAIAKILREEGIRTADLVANALLKAHFYQFQYRSMG